MSETERSEAVRALFHGLCLFWGIPAEAAGDRYPACVSDLVLPGRPPVCVVIVPEPGSRDEAVMTLLGNGARVLMLDEPDVDELRRCQGRVQAKDLVRWWTRYGVTHASRDYERPEEES